MADRELIVITDLSNAILARELRSGRMPTDEEFKQGWVNHNGGAVGDLKVFRYTDATTINRHKQRHRYTIDGGGAVDFSGETTMAILAASTSKTEVNGDGVDESTVTLELFQVDAAGVRGAKLTGFNGTRDVPIEAPYGQIKARVSFTAGTGTVKIRKRQATDFGTWTIPGVFRDDAVKMRNDADSAVTVEILQDLS